VPVAGCQHEVVHVPVPAVVNKEEVPLVACHFLKHMR
jgi:hypothetical protein